MSDRKELIEKYVNKYGRNKNHRDELRSEGYYVYVLYRDQDFKLFKSRLYYALRFYEHRRQRTEHLAVEKSYFDKNFNRVDLRDLLDKHCNTKRKRICIDMYLKGYTYAEINTVIQGNSHNIIRGVIEDCVNS